MRRFLLLPLALLSLAQLGFGRDLTTLSGQKFHDVVVTGIESDGLDIRFQGGTALVKFADLPGDEVAAFFQTGAPEAPAPQLQGAVAGPGPQVNLDAEEAADNVAPGPGLEYLPEIDALDGSVFNDVYITSIGRTGFRFRHRNGFGFLDFSQLQDGLRRRFGFNETTYAQGLAWREQRVQRIATRERQIAADAAARLSEAQRSQPMSAPAMTQMPSTGWSLPSGGPSTFGASSGVGSRAPSSGIWSGSSGGGGSRGGVSSGGWSHGSGGRR